MVEEARLSIVCSCEKLKKVILKLTDRIVGTKCNCNVFYIDKEGTGHGPLTSIKIDELELLER